MAYTNPSVADFKMQFNRDFPYGNDDLSTIQDADISKAQFQAQLTINASLFYNQDYYNLGINLLSAYFLVQNLRSSSQGIAAKFDWATNSKTVAQVSASFSIPQRILDNPEFSIYAANAYGVQYLAMVLPLLVGAMFPVAGGTVGYPGNGGLFSGVYGSIGPWGGEDNS
jgi:hypothetical protein